MNFLAHLYLSGGEDLVRIGNFIGDHVKGKQYLSFTEPVQKGILLHRRIDDFTDRHVAVRECADLLRPVYHRYAGVIVDLYFDHFLAREWSYFSSMPLTDYTRGIHALLIRHFWMLPGKVKQFLPFLIRNRRLQSYATVDGIIRALEIMSNHTSLPAQSEFARSVLIEYDAFLYDRFSLFMTEIIRFVQTEGETILSNQLDRSECL